MTEPVTVEALRFHSDPGFIIRFVRLRSAGRRIVRGKMDYQSGGGRKAVRRMRRRGNDTAVCQTHFALIPQMRFEIFHSIS